MPSVLITTSSKWGQSITAALSTLDFLIPTIHTSKCSSLYLWELSTRPCLSCLKKMSTNMESIRLLAWLFLPSKTFIRHIKLALRFSWKVQASATLSNQNCFHLHMFNLCIMMWLETQSMPSTMKTKWTQIKTISFCSSLIKRKL